MASNSLDMSSARKLLQEKLRPCKCGCLEILMDFGTYSFYPSLTCIECENTLQLGDIVLDTVGPYELKAILDAWQKHNSVEKIGKSVGLYLGKEL